MRLSLFKICALPAALVLLSLSACSPDAPPQTGSTAPSEVVPSLVEQPATNVAFDAEFTNYSESLMQRMLQRNPEWSLFSGRYDDAHRVTLPDETRRADDLLFIDAELAQLAQFDP